MNKNLVLPKEKINDFCRRNHISRLAVFGSALTEDFSKDSDVDVLVEFQPGHVPGFAFFTMQDELSDLLGRKIDLVSRKGIERSRNYIRRRAILETSEVIYAAA